MKPLMSFNKDHNNHHLAEKGTGREDTHWMGQKNLKRFYYMKGLELARELCAESGKDHRQFQSAWKN